LVSNTYIKTSMCTLLTTLLKLSILDVPFPVPLPILIMSQSQAKPATLLIFLLDFTFIYGGGLGTKMALFLSYSMWGMVFTVCAIVFSNEHLSLLLAFHVSLCVDKGLMLCDDG